MCLKFHPDKHSSGSPEQIAKNLEIYHKVGEAKTILTNKTKRQIYDQFGLRGLDRLTTIPDDEQLELIMKAKANWLQSLLLCCFCLTCCCFGCFFCCHCCCNGCFGKYETFLSEQQKQQKNQQHQQQQEQNLKEEDYEVSSIFLF